MGVIETLKKISYDNLDQFVQDLNRNFAVIQSSPLYKGIPGEEGESGTEGLRGIRGSQFLFANLQKFNEQFPSELMNASKITLDYINSKMAVFETKQKLLKALGVIEFVNNDIIVLTNSIMLSYDNVLDTFVDTKLAFNEQSNLVSSVETKIEDYVQYYIDNNPTIQPKNLFEAFDTYAKNYTDTDDTNITTTLTDTSVYAPLFPGLTNTSGIKLADHKYYGFSDKEFPKNNRGTIVFGSIKQYIELLMNTTETSENETLTSDYAPGENNIPAAVILQDTPENGLLFGLKTKSNLKSFGSLYKDADGNIVLKSDTGKITAEFSKLLLNKNQLSYDKKVIFKDTLDIWKNINIRENISGKFLRTGTNAGSENSNLLEVGSIETGSVQKNISESIIFSKYTNNILVTDGNGLISKGYSLETATKPTDGTAFNGGSTSKFITSDYILWLYNMISATSNTTTNFYRKSEFTNGTIPSLKLSQNLEVVGTTILKQSLKSSEYTTGSGNYLISAIPGTSGGLFLGAAKTTTTDTNTTVRSTNLLLSNYLSKVLVTDSSGKILKSYTLCTDSIDDIIQVPTSSTATNTDITGRSSDSGKILTGVQQGWIVKFFNEIKTRFKNTYNKTEVDTAFLKKADNLSALTDKAVALTNLGVYSKTTSDARYLLETNNLSDLTNLATARSNLQILSSTYINSTFVKKSANLSDLTDKSTSRTNLSVYSKSEGDARYLLEANNLSDLANVATALTNLGVYSKTTSDARYLLETNNLNDLTNLTIARSNLGVYSTAEVYSRTTADSRYFRRRGHLGSARNLNDLSTTEFLGIWHQNTSQYAIDGANYPTGQAGFLEVFEAAGIVQRYTTYGTYRKMYIRSFYNDTWYDWAEILTTLNALKKSDTVETNMAIHKKVIPIGPWNMNDAVSKNIPHGLDWKKIINITGVIRKDSDRVGTSTDAIRIIANNYSPYNADGSSNNYTHIDMRASKTDIAVNVSWGSYYQQSDAYEQENIYMIGEWNRGFVIVEYID